MKFWIVKVTRGGRMTLPKEVIELLKLHPGDKVCLISDGPGVIRMKKHLQS